MIIVALLLADYDVDDYHEKIDKLIHITNLCVI